MTITLENFAMEYIDPIEQMAIDKFVCNEMSRQVHRYIKGMSGTKQAMLRFEERLSSLTLPEKEDAIAKYIDLNRRALDGLDFKVVLARAIANYCDTYQYMLELINNQRKMIYYYLRMKDKYVRFHEVFERDGKFGIKDYKGDILISPNYDYLRTFYIYSDDLAMLPFIAQKDGKMGLVYPDGKDTLLADFIYDEISLREEYPFFEATKGGEHGYIDKEGNFHVSRDPSEEDKEEA